jgi:hypothetical protein
MTKPDKGWARRRGGAEVKKNARSKDAAKVVAQIQKEAEEAGATLKNDGKGGLDPHLALKVFRREKWKCAVPNCKTPQEDLDLDHIGGHPLEIKDDPDADAFIKKAAKMGHADSPKNIHAVCARHHDMFHERERDLEDDKKPKPMKE